MKNKEEKKMTKNWENEREERERENYRSYDGEGVRKKQKKK